MIEPKTFYRKLDALVSAIGKAQTSRNFLYLIFAEVYAFGNRAKWEDDATVVVIKRVGA